MTRAQEDTIDRLATAHGRVCVRDGYADDLVRVTAPGGAHWLVDEAGHASPHIPNHSIDWSYQ